RSTVSKLCLGRMLALVCLLGLTACATSARQIGEASTEGAIDALSEQKKEPGEGVTSISREAAEEVTKGLLDALSAPEQVMQMRQFVDALVSQSLRSAAGGGVPGPGAGSSGNMGGGGTGVGPGVGGAGPVGGGAGMGSVSGLTGDVTRALGMELERLLGPDGKGPLAQSLAATAGQVATSMIQQSRDELGTLFPECAGLGGTAARACMEERVAQLGAAFSRGATVGVRQALQPWLFLLAFGGGLLVGLLVFLGWSAARVNRQMGGRAGTLRQQRPV
ncbi:hypothetical protein, partial [Archangium sp.]|uniref:hypothetical protein n=1 Tax=Archangium sp. TaxID=1872627 RepID=UPI002D328CCE